MKKQKSTFAKVTHVVIWGMLIIMLGSVVLTAVTSIM